MITVEDPQLQQKIKKLHDMSQQHIFRFWESLDGGRRGQMLKQIGDMDLGLLQHFIQKSKESAESENLELQPAPIITMKERQEKDEEARREGEEYFRQGKVAAFLVAGGQGTRLGYDGPKGAFPVTPVRGKSLFQLHAEKIRALEKRYHVTLPWYIMTSQTNNEETQQFFKKNEYFGLNPQDVFFLIQQMVPAIDRNGKLILDAPHHLFMNPNGHGGSLKALWDSGAIDDMKKRGIRTVFYFQVDNVLTKICDPLYIGYHILHDSDMSNKVVRKKYPEEKMGVLCLINGKMGLMEYSDLSESDMFATDKNGELKYWAGNIATHMLEVDFIEKENEGGFHLPYHIAEKSVPYVNDDGDVVHPDKKNGLKFETFVFDALPDAGKTVSIEVERHKEFSALKNSEGENSPQTVRNDLNGTYATWLETAGYKIKRDKNGEVIQDIEISPLCALSSEDLKGKKLDFDANAEEIYIE
jgi:UDP-N-acetylglucosamine/UDP-N-acetylgalactosamine diphosphorylase